MEYGQTSCEVSIPNSSAIRFTLKWKYVSWNASNTSAHPWILPDRALWVESRTLRLLEVDITYASALLTDAQVTISGNFSFADDNDQLSTYDIVSACGDRLNFPFQR